MHRSVASSVLVVAILAAVGIATLPTAAAATTTRATPSAAASTASPGAAPVQRVLVISLPHVAWRDLEGVRLPNLDRLVSESAIADMTNRTIGKRDLAATYLSIGAGNRAASTALPDDGQGLQVDEQFGTLTAAEAMRQRTGASPSSGIVQLGIPVITQANDEQDVDVTVGALGDALAKGGYTRAVVGNGDGYTVDDDVVTYRRFAVNTMMDSTGTVPAGRVDATLNEPDAAAPFGVQADLDATTDAFTEAWTSHSVVLVEASDLARLGDYAPLASSAQRKHLLITALQRSDELIGRLLDQVDPRATRCSCSVPGPASTVTR